MIFSALNPFSRLRGVIFTLFAIFGGLLPMKDLRFYSFFALLLLFGGIAATQEAPSVTAPAVLSSPDAEIIPEQPFYHAPCAPLCTSKTKTVVSVDIEKAVLTPLVTKLSVLVGEGIDAFIPNQEEALKAKITVPLLLAGYVSPISRVMDEMKRTKLGSLYIIDEGVINDTPCRFVAVATGERTAEELRPLREALLGLKNLGVPVRLTFVRHGFLIAPLADVQISDEALKAQLQARFTEQNPTPNGRFDALFTQKPDSVLTLVRLNDAESKRNFADSLTALSASSVGERDERAKEFAALCEAFFPEAAAHLESVILSVSADWSVCTAALETDSPESAAALEARFKDFCQKIVAFVASGAEEKHQKGAPLYDALFTHLTPTLEGRSLLWTFDSAFADAVTPILWQIGRLSVPTVPQAPQQKEPL